MMMNNFSCSLVNETRDPEHGVLGPFCSGPFHAVLEQAKEGEVLRNARLKDIVVKI
jgi:hypothetical protein